MQLTDCQELRSCLTVFIRLSCSRTMATLKRPISVSLDEEQIERLDDLSKRTRIPRSVLVREGVEAVLARYETQLALPLASRRPKVTAKT